ncbi:MAG: sigma-70 family RNA polymerase sigma factor [Patescibacteria group bacterium]|jgi:RNA polymerase sigma-70 factor (ECF subfamily)
MTRAEEKVLVEQAQMDVLRFDALYRVFIDEIYRFIFYKVTSKEVAEDLTAQVFMQALEHLIDFRYQTGARFSSWLYAIARNQVIDYYRKHHPTVELEVAEPIVQAEIAMATVDKNIEQRRVQEILRLLPLADQEILTLRLWQDKTYAEISRITASNVVAVRARYSRAVKKFKKLYMEQYADIS